MIPVQSLKCRVCSAKIPGTDVYGLCKSATDNGDLKECGLGFNTCLHVGENSYGSLQTVRSCFHSTRNQGCIIQVRVVRFLKYNSKRENTSNRA